MLKVLHGADFHLDSPFSGLKPDAAARRRGEQRELLARLTDLAREREADLVLLSGDLLDGDLVFRETVQALARALGEIPCPVFLAPGNHDWYGPQSPYAALEWPGNVHLFTGPELGAVRLPELGCTVWGAAFCAPRQSASPLRGFHAPAEGVQLAVLHGEVAAQGDYGPISEEDIAASGLDYLALGHVHAPSAMNRAGNTVWAYPGCPQGRGFDELGERGFLFGDVEPGRVDMRFVPFAGRRYESLTVDVSGGDALDAIRRSLPPDTSRDIYRIRLTGETAEPLTLAPLERALSGEFFRLELRDDTRLRRDLWDRCGDDTLRGLFLRRLRQEYDAAAPRRQKEIEQAVRFGLAALKGVGRNVINGLLEERSKDGPFTDFMDFCDRMFDHDLNRRVLESLIKSGAFDRMGCKRSQLMEVFGQVLDGIAASRKRNVEGQLDLFGMGGGEAEQAALPALHLANIPEYTPQQLMTMEKEVTGLYLTGHPMDAYREAARRRGAVTIGSILSDFAREDGPAVYRDGQMVKVAGVISTYKTRTTRNNTLMAYVSLEDDTGGMELLVFARALDQSGGYIRENQAILASGRISVRDEKEPQLMADEIRPLDTPEAEERREAGERKLFIRLPGPDDPRTRKVKLALSFFPGEQPVVLYYQDIRKQSKGYCMIHPSLLADLRERLGEENVVVQ